MSDVELNPYRPPASDLDVTVSEAVDEPRRVDASNGWLWVVEGWSYFKQAPLLWIGMLVVIMFINVGLALIPLVSLGLTILSPIFMGGLMLGCASLRSGEGLRFSHLFAGFSNEAGNLAIVGLLYLLMVLGVSMVAGIVIAVTVGASMASGSAEGLLGALLVGLVAMALLIPVFMAYWFAPALVVLNGMRPVAALKASFRGCMANVLPFLVYGAAALVLGVALLLPMGLAILAGMGPTAALLVAPLMIVMGPVLIASIYVSYVDIFASPE